MDEFAKLEYETLRKEIENSKKRLFQIVAGGISINTAADYLAIVNGDKAFSLLLPFLVLAFALLFLSQNKAKFRAGHYIKEKIEPNLRKITPGWEHWLEDHREADNYIRIGFLIVFSAYYSFSTYLAGKAIGGMYAKIDATNLQNLTWFSFLIFGLVFACYLISHSKTSFSE